MINQKGQEEMVGFVLIVVIVSVILVVVLGMLMRNQEVSTKDLGTSQFLESMMEYTTKCAIGYTPRYASIGELISHCYDNKVCTSGKKACEVLNESLNEIINSSWYISPEGAYKGYDFDSIYEKGTKTNTIIKTKKGDCTQFKGADTFFEHQGGIITSTLKICTA